jgi:hypothetical protein
MAENRTDREVANRDANTREKSVRQWAPAAILPDPKPQPGWVFRWVRTSILGQNDLTNMSGKLREGWEPVKGEDHPELMLETNKAGNVEIGGLILCKAPKELMDQRDAYYSKQTRAQMDSVNNTLMRENDPRMPLFKEHKSEVSRSRFGTGNSNL